MDVLMLCYSDLDGQHRIPLEREITSIGRSPNQDIVMSDLSVSRCHAVILREGSEYTVVDQQSTHGTFLNGARIQQGMLKPGDLPQLGLAECSENSVPEGRYPHAPASLLGGRPTVIAE